MKHHFIPIYILFLFVLSCNTNHTNHWENKTHNLEGKTITLNHYFYTPRDICIKDSIIFIKDYGSDTIFYAYNIYENPAKLLNSFGTKGEGPYEYMFPSPLRIIKNNICFFDRSLLKYQTIDLSNKNIHSEKVSSLGFNNIIKINDSTYVGDGFFHDSRFKLLKKDSCSNLSIHYPNDNIECSSIQKSLAYQGNIIQQPNGYKFVYVSTYGGIIEIYQIEENDINLLYNRNYHFPQYTPYDHSQNEVDANFKADNIKGGLSTYATDKFIYILYSGKTLSDPDHNYSNTVYVLDWNGNEVYKYVLDQNLSCICIDCNDQFLYGIYYNENDIIGLTKYNLITL